MGWSTNSTATTPTYTNGQSVKNLTSSANGSVTLYAVWVKTYSEYGYYDREDEIHEGNIVTENFALGFDRSALVANGYKRIAVTMILEAKEGWWFHNCKPLLYVFSRAGDIKHAFKGLEIVDGWNRYTYEFELDFDALLNDGSITIGYSAEEYPNTSGNQAEWWRGNTVLCVTALK